MVAGQICRLLRRRRGSSVVCLSDGVLAVS
jgi:hypothetical protein